MERNPHHPTTKSYRDQWHKIVVLLMLKMNSRHVVISPREVGGLAGENIVIQELPGGIHLRLVNDEEAVRLARREGGQSLS